MKSKLRSRWYRANEKPLESSSDQKKESSPFGELQNPKDGLVDDLSKVCHQKGSQKSEKSALHSGKGKSSHGKRKRQISKSNPKQNPNRHKANRNNSTKKNKGKDGKTQSNHPDNISSKSPKGKNRNNKKSKNSKDNKDSSKKDPTSKKSGLGGFISKIFGRYL